MIKQNNLNSIITLRDTMTLKYPVAYSFHRIVLHTDLPYDFNQERKYWWRWYSDIYGFFYNRVKRSYSIWLTMFLKHNIGIYISFLFKMPGKHSHILDDWKRRAFLYTLSLKKKTIYSDFMLNKFKKLNFWTVNYLDLNEAAKNILFPGNKVHRAMGSPGISGLDLDTFISSYNGKWNNLYKPESMFYNTTRMPKDFFVVVNSFFIASGFFISSFDSMLVLYPQFFLEYCTKLYNQNILDIISFFSFKFNIFFYLNILILLLNIYLDFFNYKFIKFVHLNIFFNFDVYKINLYLYFVKYYYPLLSTLNSNNYWFLFTIFLNNLNVNNILLMKNIKNISIAQNYKFINILYFLNFFKSSELWLKNKKNYNWIYDCFFKYLNKFNLLKQLYVNNNVKTNLIKKLYIFNYVNFWKFLNNWNLKFNNIKRKKQSLFFINSYIKLLNYKYGNIPNIYNLMRFFSNIQYKYFNKQNFKSFSFIKPSVMQKRPQIVTTLRGMTNFGKYFVNVPDSHIETKKISIFYSKMPNTSRALLYFKYSRFFLAKLSEFLKNFFFLIMSTFKLNFGFSYSLITKKKNIKNLDKLMSYNIQYYLYLFLLFLKTYFVNNKNKPVNSFLYYNLKLTDKAFFFLYFLHTKTNIKRNHSKYIFKGMNLNKLAYLKFFNFKK